MTEVLIKQAQDSFLEEQKRQLLEMCLNNMEYAQVKLFSIPEETTDGYVKAGLIALKRYISNLNAIIPKIKNARERSDYLDAMNMYVQCENMLTLDNIDIYIDNAEGEK